MDTGVKRFPPAYYLVFMIDTLGRMGILDVAYYDMFVLVQASQRIRKKAGSCTGI